MTPNTPLRTNKMSCNLTTILGILKVGRRRTCQVLLAPKFQLLIQKHHKSNAAMDLIIDKFKLLYLSEYVKLISHCPSEDQNTYLQVIYDLFPKSLKTNKMDIIQFLINKKTHHNESLIESEKTFEYYKTIALVKLNAKTIELDNLIENLAANS